MGSGSTSWKAARSARGISRTASGAAPLARASCWERLALLNSSSGARWRGLEAGSSSFPPRIASVGAGLSCWGRLALLNSS